MEVKNAVKTITQAANLQSCDIAKKLNITPSSYAMFINGDLRQINRLIKICEICSCELKITNNNGFTIKLESNENESKK